MSVEEEGPRDPSDPGDPGNPREMGADVVGRHRGLLGRTALVSFLTLASRILGYVREMLSAALFGDSSGVYDAFVTAWRVPNLFRRFLGEGALSTSFQTALTRVDAEAGTEAGRRLFHQTLALLLKILVGLCIGVMVLVAFLPDRMPGMGWAWLGADPGAVRELTLRLMPFVVLACVIALFAGALNVRGHFALPAGSPVLMNLVWIAVLIALVFGVGRGDGSHLDMTRFLAWGVLAAGGLQLVAHLPVLRRLGLLGPRPTAAAPADLARPSGPPGPTAVEVLRRSTPLALGAAVYQVNVMIDGLMAEGLLADGGPTLHYYANRVQQFPMALIAFAATSAVFPALQALGHKRDLTGVRDLHDRTHRAIAFVALPASVGLFVLAEPVIAVSFERGAFGEVGVARATRALQWLALAILPAGASGLVARTYYSLGDFRYPVRISSRLLVLNAFLNVLCVEGLSMDVDGLALSTGITSWLGLAFLLRGLGPRLGLPALRAGMAGGLMRMSLASSLCGLAAYTSHPALVGALGRALGLVAAIAMGITAYAFSVQLFAVPEAREFRRRLGTRLARRRGRGRPG